MKSETDFCYIIVCTTVHHCVYNCTSLCVQLYIIVCTIVHHCMYNCTCIQLVDIMHHTFLKKKNPNKFCNDKIFKTISKSTI